MNARIIEKNGFFMPETRFVNEDLGKWLDQAKTLDLALPYVQNFDHALDVGAYIGLWTIRMGQSFDKVTAFEPVPENYTAMQMNLEDTGISVHPVNKAVGSHVGTTDMRLKGANHATITPERESTHTFKTTSIDSYGFDDIGLIKLDIEGMERQALQGAQKTIKRCSPVICIEIKFHEKEIDADLREMGYSQVFKNKLDAIYART